MISFVSPLLPRLTRFAPHYHPTSLRHTRRAQSPASSRSPINACTSSGWDIPDFDRDYYNELKAEYGDDPNISIYSKDDYETNPLAAPWLHDHRARDIKQIRKSLIDSPIEDGELTDVPTRPMRVSDLHTKEEIDVFEKRARQCEPTGGEHWSDPMPESDFDLDPEWIHLRKMDEKDLEEVQEAPEILSGDPDRPVLKCKQYNSGAEELADLDLSYERMIHAEGELGEDLTSYSENIPTPSREQFDKWQREAEKRGGNATGYESYFLAPFRDNLPDASDISEQKVPPPQHDALVQHHKGKWTGFMTVFSVDEANKFSPAVQSVLTCASELSTGDDDELEWNTIVSIEDMEVVSSLTFSSLEGGNHMEPGRGVDDDGSYVCNGKVDESDGQDCVRNMLSLQQGAIKKIVADASSRGAIELCCMAHRPGVVTRHRVILCTRASNGKVGKVDKKSKRRQHTQGRFSHVVLITERKQGAKQLSKPLFDLSVVSSRDLLGGWEGKCTLLQPEYPPMSMVETDTRQDIRRVSGVKESDVTWSENQFPDKSEDQERESGTGQQASSKKRISRRVANARAHDRKRLADCTLMITDKTGDVAPRDTQAWQLLPAKNEDVSVSFMYSPRVGKFCDDYCAIVLSESLLVMFPHGKAFPTMWNTVTVQQITKPKRKRIVAGRNEEGALVGVLFATENLDHDEAWDDVACYV